MTAQGAAPPACRRAFNGFIERLLRIAAFQIQAHELSGCPLIAWNYVACCLERFENTIQKHPRLASRYSGHDVRCKSRGVGRGA